MKLENAIFAQGVSTFMPPVAAGFDSISRFSRLCEGFKPMINFICLCFKVFANESESEERLSGFAIVEVDLININDNEPKFNQSSYNFTYDEEIHEGFVIGTVMVRICYSFLFCFMFVDVSSSFR